MPNYLNPHNVDPSRVEAAPMRNAECGMLNKDRDAAKPARCEKLPGNDSIRPGQNKCGMPEGAPFDEYGVQIGLAGGEWAKGIQDYAEQGGPFPSDSRLRHFVRHGQPPTMSNADAIEVLKHLEADIYGRIAIAKAIDALRERENETD